MIYNHSPFNRAASFDRRTPECDITDICMQLNHNFANFLTGLSIGAQRAGRGIGIGLWNFLWQIILAKELAVRVAHSGCRDTGSSFTPRVLASLIVQDLWLQNVTLQLVDAPVIHDAPKSLTAAEEVAAAGHWEAADKALAVKDYDGAFAQFGKALNIDPGNAAYRAGRASASLGLGNGRDALEDAFIVAHLEPNKPVGWLTVGAAQLQRGMAKRALEAYQRAINIAGPSGVTEEMQRGLYAAQSRIQAEHKAVEEATAAMPGMDRRTARALRDRDFDTAMRAVQLHSTVHQRQVAGLLFFAARMKWPHTGELRMYAEEAYATLFTGGNLPLDVHDWLFGMSLPGRWAAFKVMVAMVLCTPSVKELGERALYDCGLSLPEGSYWRLRTVLGSVLGALPGAASLCGWVGRCPAPEFDPPVKEYKLRYVRLRARKVAPSPAALANSSYRKTVGMGSADARSNGLHLGANEDIEAWAAEYADASSWVDLPPPQPDGTVVSLKGITMKQMSLEPAVAAQVANGTISDAELAEKTEYQAVLSFEIDSRPGRSIALTMYTSPVFVTLPPCFPPRGASTAHKVHTKDSARYASLKTVSVTELVEYQHVEDTGAGGNIAGLPLVINATAQGGELMARAWCAATGKSAAIRKPGGPCYVCALEASARNGLGAEALIWAS